MVKLVSMEWNGELSELSGESECFVFVRCVFSGVFSGVSVRFYALCLFVCFFALCLFVYFCFFMFLFLGFSLSFVAR
jgi:hypothetical protein